MTYAKKILNTVGKSLKEKVQRLKKIQKAIRDKARRVRKDREYLKVSVLGGKMTGIRSITTPSSCNPICCGRAKIEGTICRHCYAFRTLKQYSNCEKSWAKNFGKLQNVISWEKLPITNDIIFRIESHGDVASKRQAYNYLNVAKKNPQTWFGIWTKNYRFYKEAVEMLGEKPENVSLVVSSPYINKQLDIKDYPLADHVFTVYDAEYAAEHDIDINCGAAECLTCQKCYHKNGNVYINELLK